MFLLLLFLATCQFKRLPSSPLVNEERVGQCPPDNLILSPLSSVSYLLRNVRLNTEFLLQWLTQGQVWLLNLVRAESSLFPSSHAFVWYTYLLLPSAHISVRPSSAVEFHHSHLRFCNSREWRNGYAFPEAASTDPPGRVFYVLIFRA